MTALDGSGSIIRSEGLRDCSYVLFEDIGFVLCVSPRKDSKPTSKDGKCPVGAQLVVTDCGMFSLFKIGRWISLPAPSPGLLGTTGLGSSLGAGEGRIVLEFLCGNVTGGIIGLDILVRGVGRTGAPAPIIHDFFRAPPKNVLRVALDESTSLSDRACPSLSGGRRIAQKSNRANIDVENMRSQIRL